MSPRSLLVALAVLIAGCPARQPIPRKVAPRPAAEVYRPYTFTLDGKPFKPFVYSQEGEPERPRPGDVIELEDIPIMLGEERVLRFVVDAQDRETRIHVVGADRQRRLVGLKVSSSRDYENDRDIASDALARLSPAEIRSLQGLLLDAWPPGTDGRLQHLDPRRTCLKVGTGSGQGKERRFPPLPAGLSCLGISDDGDRGFKDYSPVVVQRELRILLVDPSHRPPIDLRHLSSSRGLRVLGLGWASLTHAEAPSDLAELRMLDLRSNLLTDIGFVSRLRHLRRIDLQRSEVRSLAPLQGLSHLVEVDANRSKVSVLPAGRLPALRRMKLVLSKVETQELRRFQAANPGCLVFDSLNEMIRNAMAGADRVLVRTGYAGENERDRILFERRGAEAVSELMTALEVHEGGGDAGCGCFGYPTIEVRLGDRLLTRFRLHHGQYVSWSGWSGNLSLTEVGGDRLAAWMSWYGFDGLTRERKEIREQWQARRRRLERLQQLTPAPVWTALKQAYDTPLYIAAFDLIQNATDRERLVLRLFGCDLASWNLYLLMDRLISDHLLGRIDASTWTAVLAHPLTDPDLVDGLARALFGEDLHRKVDPKALARVLLPLARAGWSHPRLMNRHATLAALGRIGTREAIAALRAYVTERPGPRPLPVEQQREPERSLNEIPTKHQPPVEGGSELAHAAYLLAKLGDKRSASTIRKLAATATGADLTLLKQAIELLARKPARTPPRR